MKNTIELYIAGKLIDLSDDSLVLWTYQKTDYTHPTAIKNSYTKTITIPGTQNNNQVFNTIYKLDRFQTSSIFNPAKRTPFQIFKAGDLIEEGYCKLDNINKANNFVSYSLTLYGGLGDFMYGLTYDEDGNKLDLSDLSDYYWGKDPLLPEQVEGHIYFKISSDAIMQAWSRLRNGLDSENEFYTDRRYNTGGLRTDQFDVINFAPAYNGIPENDNFDPSKVFLLEWYNNPYNLVNSNTLPINDVRTPNVRLEITGDDSYTYSSGSGRKKKTITANFDGLVYINASIFGPNTEGETTTMHINSLPLNPDSSTDVFSTILSERLSDTRITSKERDLRWGVLNLKEDATEWQVRDLRSYMQRPVVRVKKIFEAIQRYAEDVLGYSVDLDPSFFNLENEYYNGAWITLPLLHEQEKSVKSGDSVYAKSYDKDGELNNIGILENTDTPADYLTSFLKLFNLHIICSRVDKRVSILTRDNFYFKTSTVVDLENKVDRSSMEIKPLNFDFKYLKFRYEDGESELLKDYKNSFDGTEYGSRRWNTDYDFDNGTKDEPEKFIFKNALDVLEKDTFFSSMWSGGGGQPDSNHPEILNYAGSSHCGIYPACMNGNGMSWSLFSKKSEEESKDSDIKFSEEERSIIKIDGRSSYAMLNTTGSPLYIGNIKLDLYNNGDYYDAFPKPQFHSESNKASDGKNVLLFFNGTVEPIARTHTQGGQVVGFRDIPSPYFLTDDIVMSTTDGGDMKTAIGTRCWVQPQFVKKNYNRPDIIVGTGGDSYDTPLWDGGYTLYYIPMFNRNIMDFETKTIESSFDFGQPKTLYIPQFTEPEESTITKRYKWEAYLQDVFSVNTREIKCRIILDEPNEALRRFYYFDGAHWILIKLSDYDYDQKFNSATFIKVNSISNYTSYLFIDTPKLDFDYTLSMKTLTASYGGYGERELIIEPLSDWISVERIETKAGEGDDDYITSFKITSTENNGTITRSGLVNIVYGDISQAVEVIQTPSSMFAITYNNIPNSIPYDGGSYIIEATNTTGITPTISSPSWVHITTTTNPDGTIHIDVAVDENNGDNREGEITLTIGDDVISVPVFQEIEPNVNINNAIPNPVPYDGGSWIISGSWAGNETPEITSEDSWIHLNPIYNPDNTFTVVVSVDENNSSTTRDGIISVSVGDKVVPLVINQEEKEIIPPVIDSLVIIGIDIPDVVPYVGGDYSINATYTGTSPVFDVSEDWIHIIPTVNDDGTINISVSVDENIDSIDRYGNVMISVGNITETITIHQKRVEYHTLTVNALPDNATINFS